MNELKTYVKTLKDLLELSILSIPPYQRPYSWNEKQIEPLLTDLHKRNENDILIMGGIILHKHDNILDIVDGQQRLITFLIIKLLTDNNNFNLFPSWELNNSDSKKNIQDNARYIKQFIDKKKELYLNNIYFIVIETTKLDDAFAFFDSQNTRGKKLEDYDILKAHHLRYIKSDSLSTLCAKDWENIEKDKDVGLGLLLETFLARGRRWTNKEYQRPDIKEEFKSQRQKIEYKESSNYILNRYQQPSLFDSWKYDPTSKKSVEFNFKLLDATYKVGGLEINDNIFQFLPFQITETVEGGELFFWYTHKYYALTKELFSNEKSKTSKSFKFFLGKLKEFNYNTGAAYVNDVYKGALLFYFDKFGYYELENVAVELFYCIYWLRMKQPTIQYSSIYIFMKEFNPYSLINEASFPEYIVKKCFDYLEGKYIERNGFIGIRKKMQDELFNNPNILFISNHFIFKQINKYI